MPAGVAQPTFGLTDISQQVNVGTLPIMAKITSADAGNYTVTYTNAGQLTINKAAVTITAPQGLSKPTTVVATQFQIVQPLLPANRPMVLM